MDLKRETKPDGTFVILWGVWIAGRGWLSQGSGADRRVFSDPRRELALSAQELYGKDAVALPIDQSLVDLEGEFLQRERERPNLWRILTIGQRPFRG